ncbi:MAG: hypothetical protein WCS27_05470 [Victivallaceae bacterium]
MLSDGTGWNNTWNGENRLIETYNDTAGKKLEFVYDYLGRPSCPKTKIKELKDEK